MQNLEFRDVVSTEELEIFLDRVENYTDVRLPMAYARNARVVGVYTGDSLVGGYMLVTKPEFRSLMFVPDECKTTNSFFATDTYEMMEVNGLWVGPGIKSPKAQFKVWIHLLFDVLKCRKKYLLLMCNLRNKTIQNIHNLTNPVELYSGTPQLLGGQKTHGEVKVSYTTRWRALANFPKYIAELRSREVRAASAVKKRDLASA